MRAKEMKVVYKDGKEEIFSSIKECAIKMGVSSTRIIKRIQRGGADKNGMRFSYTGNKGKDAPHKGRGVMAILPNGETEAFKSVVACAAFFGINRMTIYSRIEEGTPNRQGVCFDWVLEG